MQKVIKPEQLLMTLKQQKKLTGLPLLDAYRKLTKIHAIRRWPMYDDRDDLDVLLLSLSEAERQELGFDKFPDDISSLQPAPPLSLPVYDVKVKAILCANDDGSGGASEPNAVTADHIRQVLEAANLIYQPAGIQFVYDLASDFIQENNTLLNLDFTVPDGLDYNQPESSPPLSDDQIRELAQPHEDERQRVSRQYCGYMVLLFCDGNMLVYDSDLSRWVISSRSYAFSGSNLEFVALPTGQGNIQGFGNLVAHETGHYFHQWHTHRAFHFADGWRLLVTVDELATLIRNAVDAGNVSVTDGLEMFDADISQVDDTPPDAGHRVFDTEYGSHGCGPEDSITIPVSFSDGSSHSYTLQPDRGNIMSYFKHCLNIPMHFSSAQIVNMRRTLETLNRQHLIKPILCTRLRHGLDRILGPLVYAWIIIIGALMITPDGIVCIACGPVLSVLLGIVSIVTGGLGYVRYRAWINTRL